MADLTQELRVRHVKRGSEYTIVALGKMQCAEPISDMAEVVIYRGDAGQFWVRPKEEFADGRFERIGEKP